MSGSIINGLRNGRAWRMVKACFVNENGEGQKGEKENEYDRCL